MSNRRIHMFEYQQILHHLKKGCSVRSIMRNHIAGRRKIREVVSIASLNGWLDNNTPLPSIETLSQHFSKRSIKTSPRLEPFREWIEMQVLQGIKASTIHRHLVQHKGFQGAYDGVKRLVCRIKQHHAPLKATMALHFQPGEAAQIDFGKGPVMWDTCSGKEVSTWFFVMTLCWSRHQFAKFVVHQDSESWLQCFHDAFEFFGGVPDKLIIDNPKCGITKAGYYEAEIQRNFSDLAIAYNTLVAPCPPRDPKKKGRVERGVQYIKTSFLPLRTFANIDHANMQLIQWIMEEAGLRNHGSTFEKPLDRFVVEQKKLKPLPNIKPDTGVWLKVSVHNNGHVRHQSCFYSVPYTQCGKFVWLRRLVSVIEIYTSEDNVLLATHPRLFKAGSFATNPAHLGPKAQAFIERTPSWCRLQAQTIGINTLFVVEALLTNPVQDLLRAAQGVIKLSDRYGGQRLVSIAFGKCTRWRSKSAPLFVLNFDHSIFSFNRFYWI